MNMNQAVQAVSSAFNPSDFNLTQQALEAQLQSFAELVNTLVRQPEATGRAV